MPSEFFKELAERQKAIQAMLDQYERETATTSARLANETREMVRDLAARFAAGDNNPDLLRLLQATLEGALGSEPGTTLKQRHVQIQLLTARVQSAETEAEQLRQAQGRAACEMVAQPESSAPLTPKELGRRFNAKRRKKYQSDREAAKDLGISVSTLHRWEGVMIPSCKHAEVIAEKLQWSEYIWLARSLRPTRKTGAKCD